MREKKSLKYKKKLLQDEWKFKILKHPLSQYIVKVVQINAKMKTITNSNKIRKFAYILNVFLLLNYTSLILQLPNWPKLSHLITFNKVNWCCVIQPKLVCIIISTYLVHSTAAPYVHMTTLLKKSQFKKSFILLKSIHI